MTVPVASWNPMNGGTEKREGIDGRERNKRDWNRQIRRSVADSVTVGIFLVSNNSINNYN